MLWSIALLGACAGDVDRGWLDGVPLRTDIPYATGTCRSAGRLSPDSSPDDSSVLGFSGADVFEAVNTTPPALLTWHTGETTRMMLRLETSTAVVSVDMFPPYQGYCTRRLWVREAAMLVTSDDGSLDLSVPASLVGSGENGVLENITLATSFGVAFVRPTPLPIPEDWSSPARELQTLAVNAHIQPHGGKLLSCGPEDEVSDDPLAPCNNRSGGAISFTALPRNFSPESPPSDIVSKIVGWWAWEP